MSQIQTKQQAENVSERRTVAQMQVPVVGPSEGDAVQDLSPGLDAKPQD